MTLKVALSRHIPKSHAHVFNFNPLEWLSAPDAEVLEKRLLADRGSFVFENLHAWRLRADPRCPDKDKTPWAIEVPPGTFSTFQEALRQPGDDLEGRLRLFSEIRLHTAVPFVHRSPEEEAAIKKAEEDAAAEAAAAGPVDSFNALLPKEHKRPGRKPQGFSPTASVFEREGITYFREEVIAELRIYDRNPYIFWALFNLLRRAKEVPAVITGVAYGKNGRLPRPRPFVPLDQRPLVNGRVARGPDWTPKEDELLREFFASGMLISDAQFDEQERLRLIDGFPARNKAELMPMWRDFLLRDLGYRRSLTSIEQRIYMHNGNTLKKYVRDGKVPAVQMRAYRREYLGIPMRGVWLRHQVKHTWLLVLQAQGNGPVFISETKVLALRVGAIAKSMPLSTRVMAFVRSNEAAVKALQESLTDHRQLNDWFAPTPEVLTVVAEQQRLAAAALTKGDKAYLLEARRLHAWLDWSLLKHVPDEPDKP